MLKPGRTSLGGNNWKYLQYVEITKHVKGVVVTEVFQLAVIEIGRQRPELAGTQATRLVLPDGAAGSILELWEICSLEGCIAHFDRRTSSMVRMDNLCAAILSSGVFLQVSAALA